MLPISQYVIAYLISVPIFAIIDFAWIGLVAAQFYRSRIGHLMSDTVNWPPAIAFYLLFLGGLLLFVTAPAIAVKSIMQAVIWGALFGFVTYITYDLTNWATLKNWPASVAIVDILWGTLLCAVVAGGTTAVMLAFVK